MSYLDQASTSNFILVLVLILAATTLIGFRRRVIPIEDEMIKRKVSEGST